MAERAFIGALVAALITALARRSGMLSESGQWAAIACGLAAASADTWATEIGTLWGGAPRSIAHWKTVAPGMSGGVTAIGTVGAVAGAALVALLSAILFAKPLTGALALGGALP